MYLEEVSLPFMKRKFRKLTIELPLQPLTDQRPWLVIGLLFAFIFLLFAAYAYLASKGIF
ncbi:MAG: hypothetical protein AVDCRST_MAG96-1581 [uncultured Segetibacter sp.]|uniref:Uncharacterized protein n=1 Tax=uncultured Segetibacter sp. TaxID=481133 RepID=A0A6J4S9N1_9BACT|nr:MAG: hypothetical protein AVDCRST_MAG96-1581 [uncultured Segetibacter sp.]